MAPTGSPLRENSFELVKIMISDSQMPLTFYAHKLTCHACQQDVFTLLVPSFYKYETNCYHLVTRLMKANRLTRSCSNKFDII